MKISQILPETGVLEYANYENSKDHAFTRYQKDKPVNLAVESNAVTEWFDQKANEIKGESLKQAFSIGYMRGFLTGIILTLIVATTIMLIF